MPYDRELTLVLDDWATGASDVLPSTRKALPGAEAPGREMGGMMRGGGMMGGRGMGGMMGRGGATQSPRTTR